MSLMLILLIFAFPGFFITLWVIFTLLSTKNLLKKSLVFFGSCFTYTFFWANGYIPEKGFVITFFASIIITIYILEKIDD